MHPEPRAPDQHSGPPAGRRRRRNRGKKARDVQASNDSVQTSLPTEVPGGGSTAELMLLAPSVQGSTRTSQGPLTNRNTDHLSQSVFQNANNFQTRDINVTVVNPLPIPESGDGPGMS